MGWFIRCLIDEVVDEIVIIMIIIISTLHILIGYEDSG